MASTALYLGSRLIAGTGEIIGASNLDELNDVLIKNVADKDILIYDYANASWKNITFAALVDEIEKSIEIASESNVIQKEVEKDADHVAALTDAAVGLMLEKGDMAIIKELISEGKYQHTSYVWNGSAWAAMDGNYRADNVYFDEDFIFTKAIGTVAIPSSGSLKVDAAGKSLQEFFAALFAAEDTNPDITAQPSVSSCTLAQTGTYEVGTELTGLTYSAAFNAGAYQYGPSPTGVTVTAWNVVDSKGATVGTSASGSISDYIVEVGDYKITATATYSAGNYANTNLGNESTVRIAAGSKNRTSNSIKGYRNTFFGGIADVIADVDTAKTVLTNAKIRGLSKSGATLAAGSTFKMDLAPGMKTAVIAVPAGLGISTITHQEGLGAPVLSTFKVNGSPITVSVEGADGNAAIDYDVYYAALGDGFSETNHYDVTI